MPAYGPPCGAPCLDPSSRAILTHRVCGERLSTCVWGMTPYCPLRLSGRLSPQPALAGLGVPGQCGDTILEEGGGALWRNSCLTLETGDTHIWPRGSSWRWENGQGAPCSGGVCWAQDLGSCPLCGTLLSQPVGGEHPPYPLQIASFSGLCKRAVAVKELTLQMGKPSHPEAHRCKGKDWVAVTSHSVPDSLGSGPGYNGVSLFACRVTRRRFQEPLLS